MVAGYLGNSTRFDDAVVAFAVAYANQTEVDWEELVRSMKPATKKAKKTVRKKSR